MAKTKIDELIKKHGAITGTEYQEFVADLPVLSTGIPSVDMAIGQIDPIKKNGGLRARDIMEVCGAPGNGKTALSNSMIKTTQLRYPGRSIVCLFTEPPDIQRMEREGIKVEELIILGCYHPDIKTKMLLAENQLEAICDFISQSEIKLVVIDSVATLMTTNQESKELTEAAPAASLAQVFNRFVSKFVKVTNVASLLLINHYRTPLNTGFSLIPKSIQDLDTPGGKSKDFLSMVRILATSTPSWKTEGGKPVLHTETNKKIQEGLDISYLLFRNKYANLDNYRVCKVNFNFESSRFNNEEIILKFANYFTTTDKNGEIKNLLNPPVIQAGAWYKIGDNKLQGKDNAVEFLRKNPEILKQLETQLLPKSNEFFGDLNTKIEELD